MKSFFGIFFLILLCGCSRQPAEDSSADSSENQPIFASENVGADSNPELDSLTAADKKISTGEEGIPKSEAEKEYARLMKEMKKLNEEILEEGASIEYYEQTCEFASRIRKLEPYLSGSQKKKLNEMQQHLAGMIAA